jgi:thioredoxin 1
MDLNLHLEENETVVVDFAAPAWCVPCQRLAPHYEAVAEKMDGVKFLSVDIDTADPDLVESYQIKGVPTVLAFKDGELAGAVEARTAPKLVTEISSL